MRKPPRRSLLIASVYGGVILLLLLLALFAHGFSHSLGDARIAGRFAVFPLFQSRVLNELTVSWNGMALHFSRSMTPALQGIETGETGTDIVFAGEARLHLSADADAAGSLALSPSAAGHGVALIIPFTVSGSPVEEAAGSALSWKRAGQTFLLSLPAGAHADTEARMLSLPLGGGTATMRAAGAAIASAPARSLPVRAAAGPKAVRLPDEKSMPSAEQLQEAVGRFVDAAYAGWTQGRYSPATGQWKMADGSLGFSADVGVPLLAESLDRGAWQRILPLWSEAEGFQGRRTGDGPGPRAASAYLGGVREYVRALAARSAADGERARGLLQKPDPSLLAVPALIPLLLVNGGAEPAQAAANYLASVNPAGLDIPAGIALLEDLVDYGELAGANDSLSRALRELISKKVLPSVRSAESAVFLLTDAAGHSDLRAGIRCGSLLMRAGTLMKDSLASAVGRGLLASGLQMADGAGLMPASLTLSAGRIGAREGVLTPESVYALLPLERLVPKVIPASAALGPGSWLWTAARVDSLEGSATDVKIVFSYPQGIPYHLAIVGVKSFKQLRLHGIPWHSDPAYAKYSDGWAYEPSTQTLFMKITGRSGQEEISLRY